MLARQVIYAAWITGLTLQVFLGVILVSRQAWRQFPAFTAYSLVSLLQGLLLLALREAPLLYSYAFWACEVVGLVLGLAVIYELFVKLLASYRALHKFASTAFQCTVALLLLIGAGVVYFHSPVEGSRFMAAFVVVEQAGRIAEVGLIIFLFSFSRVFGLHWRQGVFGIALGVGLFITVELVGITMRAYFGIVASPALNVARVLSFNCSLLVWIGYLLAPERVTTTVDLPKTAQLERWNQAIMELIHQ
jgi:hypothetical protein